MHPTVITPRYTFRSLLYNHHLQLQVPIHEVFYASLWVVCPFRSSVYRLCHCLHYLRKQHPVFIRSSSTNVYPPGMWKDYSVCPLHVVTKRGFRNLPPSLLANYSGFIHILRRGPLSCLSTLVLGCPLLAPNETLGAHH